MIMPNTFDIINNTSTRTMFSQRIITQIFNQIFSDIVELVVKEKEVNIQGFGKFTIKTTGAKSKKKASIEQGEIEETAVVTNQIVFTPAASLTTLINKSIGKSSLVELPDD
jgi:nucleoid DNA-binding protein